MTIVYSFIPFILFVILNLYFESKNNVKGRLVSKPFLMPSLILFYVVNTTIINEFVIVALICGFLGDVFLLNTTKKSFVLSGIGAFLLGHLFYSLIFLDTTHYLSHIPAWFYSSLIVYLFLAYILLRSLFPKMKELKVPATVYLGIILVMSFLSLTRVYSVSFIAFLLPFIGSLFFILSDTILAFNLFGNTKKNSEVGIMSSYILAQFLIIYGLLM